MKEGENAQLRREIEEMRTVNIEKCDVGVETEGVVSEYGG
jgi:hypothetical protein